MRQQIHVPPFHCRLQNSVQLPSTLDDPAGPRYACYNDLGAKFNEGLVDTGPVVDLQLRNKVGTHLIKAKKP